MTGPVGNIHGHTPDGQIVYPKDHTSRTDRDNRPLGISTPVVLGGVAALVGVGAIGLLVRRIGGSGGVGGLSAQEHASEAVRLLNQARLEQPTMPIARYSIPLPPDSSLIQRVPTRSFTSTTKKALAHTDAFIDRILRDRPDLSIQVDRVYQLPDKYTPGSILGGLTTGGTMARSQGTYQQTETVLAPELGRTRALAERIRSLLHGSSDDHGITDMSTEFEQLTGYLRSIDPGTIKPPTR